MSRAASPTTLSNQAFQKQADTIPLAVTDESASIAINSFASQFLVYNDSVSVAWLAFGPSDVEADATTGMPIAAGAITAVTPPSSDYTHVAAVLATAAATGTLYLTPGAGLVNGGAGGGGGGGGGGAVTIVAPLPLPVDVAEGGVESGTAGTPSADVLTIQGPLSNRWSYAPPSGGLVSTTGVTAKAAAGVGVRNYVQSIQVINSHPTIGTEIEIRDGAAGTVLHRGWAEAAGGGFSCKCDPPLQGTADTLIEIAEVTATATTGVLVNLQGFTGT